MTTPPFPRSTAPRARRASCAVAERDRSTTGCGSSPCASPGVPLVEVRLRMPFLSARPRPTRRGPTLLAETLLTGAGGLRPGRARRRRAGARRRSRASASTPTGWCSAATSWRPNLRRSARPARRGPHRADLRRRRGRHRARAAGRAADHRPVARRRRRRRGARARGCGASTRTRVDLPQPDAVAGDHRRRRCARCTADSVRPAGAVLVVVGDVSPARVLDQVASRARRRGRARRAEPRVPALPTPGGRPAAGRRPARFGADVAADGRRRR